MSFSLRREQFVDIESLSHSPAMFKDVLNLTLIFILASIFFIIQVEGESLCEYSACECQDINNSVIVKCLSKNSSDFLNFTLPNRVKLLDLSSNDLIKCNATYSENLEILLLNNNSIQELLPESFLYVPTLKTLDLSDNLLENLHPDLFKNISTLENLYLANNKFTVTSQLNFNYLVNLVAINLDNNNIGPGIAIRSLFNTSAYALSGNIQNISISGINLTEIQENYFEPVKNTLKALIISNNNLTNFFNIPVSLEYLDVSNNPIKHLNASNFPVYNIPANATECLFLHLKVLKLNNLEISVIPRNVFTTLKLTHLELANNKYLKEISNYTFGEHVFAEPYRFPVKSLTLRGSNVSTVDERLSVLFKSVDRLDLQRNPWICDCRLTWVRNLSIAADLTEELRCAHPRRLHNAKLFDLDPEELVCPNGNVLWVGIVLGSFVCSFVLIGIFVWVFIPKLRPIFTQGVSGLRS